MASKKKPTAKTAPSKATAKSAAKSKAKTTSAKSARPVAAKPGGPAPFVRPADGTYWLMKSEPDVFSIDDLQRDGTTGWEGVRNFQARNFMRDNMKAGDLVLFYHSNAEPPGVAGVAAITGEPIPDPSQFDARSDYFDPTSDPRAPRWMMAQLRFVEKFAALLPLEVLRDDPALTGLALLQRGQRLSVQPVSSAHFRHILARAGAKTRA